MENRLEAFFHPEVREQLAGVNKPPMRDLETRLPWHHINFGPPDGTDQHEALLPAGEAYTTAEPEESRLPHDATCLFQDFATKSLLPRFVTFGTASRPAPAPGIITDEHDVAVRRYAQTICSMRRSRRDLAGRMPSGQPIAT